MIKKWIQSYLWRRKVKKLLTSPYSPEQRVKDLAEIGLNAEVLEVGNLRMVVIKPQMEGGLTKFQ